MNLKEDNLTFRSHDRRSNPYRMLLWAALIIAGLWVVVQVENNEIKPLFSPTPTPTRAAISWASEGEALFEAGDLNGAIEAYQQALLLDPGATSIWTELARVQA